MLAYRFVCKYRFFMFHFIVAVECEDNTLCLIPRQVCQADFCQPNTCTNTGQCVHGHVCSQDSRCVCEYPSLNEHITYKFERTIIRKLNRISN